MSEGTAHPEHRNCIQKTTQSRGCATIACKKRASGLKKEGESYTKLEDFLGVIQNEGNDSLSYAALKYNYFLLDLKFTEQLFSNEYQIYLHEIVPKMTEPELYRQVWRFPRKTLESKLGVKPIDPETKNFNTSLYPLLQGK